MKIRRFLHIVAVMLSSLVSMVTHAKAQESEQDSKTTKTKKGELSKHHRHHSAADANDSPPLRHNNIKNSKHAASWSALAGADAPPMKLDPSLMANAEQTETPASPTVNLSSVAPAPLPGDAESRYPWKRQIVTTTFWVGESPTHNNPVPNRSSCWDDKWAHNYGGTDTPEKAERTPDYIPASFTPGQNPFYVALPYNDMEHGAHKAEASQMIPWFSKNYKGPSKSVCKGPLAGHPFWQQGLLCAMGRRGAIPDGSLAVCVRERASAVEFEPRGRTGCFAGGA